MKVDAMRYGTKSWEDTLLMLNDDRCSLQIKKDGHHFIYEKNRDGKVTLYSRCYSKVTGTFTEKQDNVPHIVKALEFLPCGTTIVGEIYYQGKTAKEVQKVMGSKPDRAIEVQKEIGPISFYMFDILEYDGESLLNKKFKERYGYLYEVAKAVCNINCIDIAFCYYASKEKRLEKIFADGEEGAVIKHDSMIYMPGKRSKEACKIKTKDTVDAVITGFVTPEKNYYGNNEDWKYIDEDGNKVTKAWYNNWHAGVTVGLYTDNEYVDDILLDIASVASGFTDEQLSKLNDGDIGRVIEIEVMSVDNDNCSLRHPRFKMFRDDKNRKECRFTGVFNHG